MIAAPMSLGHRLPTYLHQVRTGHTKKLIKANYECIYHLLSSLTICVAGTGWLSGNIHTLFTDLEAYWDCRVATHTTYPTQWECGVVFLATRALWGRVY